MTGPVAPLSRLEGTFLISPVFCQWHRIKTKDKEDTEEILLWDAPVGSSSDEPNFQIASSGKEVFWCKDGSGFMTRKGDIRTSFSCSDKARPFFPPSFLFISPGLG